MTDFPELTVGPIVHGGHAISHLDGRTVFVRDALPGERVRVEITQVTSKIVRARAVEVLSASTDRVTPACPVSTACGGCDFQHVELSAQRRAKAGVLSEAFQRFASIDVGEVPVASVPGDLTGLGWRTRMRWSSGASGWGLHPYRSHAVTPVTRCLIAAEQIDSPPGPHVKGREAVTAVGSDDHAVTAIDGIPETYVTERVGSRQWRLRPTSFWQVHTGAADLLYERVAILSEASSGQHWWDLYSGAGLLAAALANEVGPSGRVHAVEETLESQREARRALHDLPWVTLAHESVEDWLGRQPAADAVPGVSGAVLDPPRSGAGRVTVDHLARLGVPRLVYVACDPVALARDVGLLVARGYGLRHIEAWDMFPMTHHFEVVAVLTP